MDNIDFSKVGLKMKELRKAQGITQKKVAEDLQCTNAFISNVENNHTNLNLRVLLYYASLCNVSVDLLLNAGRSDGTANSADEASFDEILQVLKMYTPAERRKIIKMLKIWKAEATHK